MEVWSDGGWTSISSIIRHRTTKPMVRVSTPTGLVDCTTDHSLVLEDGTPVGPLDVVCGTTKLLHAACTASSLSFPRTGIVYRKSKTQLECAFDFLLATASGSDAVVSFHSGMYYVTEVADEVSKTFPKPVELEFEKVSAAS